MLVWTVMPRGQNHRPGWSASSLQGKAAAQHVRLQASMSSPISVSIPQCWMVFDRRECDRDLGNSQSNPMSQPACANVLPGQIVAMLAERNLVLFSACMQCVGMQGDCSHPRGACPMQHGTLRML